MENTFKRIYFELKQFNKENNVIADRLYRDVCFIGSIEKYNTKNLPNELLNKIINNNLIINKEMNGNKIKFRRKQNIIEIVIFSQRKCTLWNKFHTLTIRKYFIIKHLHSIITKIINVCDE